MYNTPYIMYFYRRLCDPTVEVKAVSALLRQLTIIFGYKMYCMWMEGNSVRCMVCSDYYRDKYYRMAIENITKGAGRLTETDSHMVKYSRRGELSKIVQVGGLALSILKLQRACVVSHCIISAECAEIIFNAWVFPRPFLKHKSLYLYNCRRGAAFALKYCGEYSFFTRTMDSSVRLVNTGGNSWRGLLDTDWCDYGDISVSNYGYARHFAPSGAASTQKMVDSLYSFFIK